MSETAGGVDWTIDEIPKYIDGDSLRVHWSRREILDEHTEHIIFNRDDVYPNGVPVRLTWLDTPERGQEGWAEARDDVINWTRAHMFDLKVTSWADGGFSRYLGDVYYVDDNGVRHSLSQWMLTSGNGGRGWPAYVKG